MQTEKQGSRSLQGKKIVILGGSSGIGLATAQSAAAEGAEVIIASANQKRIGMALTSLPVNSLGFPVDLRREENIRGFLKSWDRWITWFILLVKISIGR